MPTPQPQGRPLPQSREELERRLLAELKSAENVFRNAAPDQKEKASERYRAALERFNSLVVDRKMPSGTTTEP